jgi:hypothetical protein
MTQFLLNTKPRSGSLKIYIVVIAWLYVILMIAIFQKTLVAGAIMFLFFGLAPCALLVWLMGRPARRRGLARGVPAQDPATAENKLMHDESLDNPDRGNTDRN